MMKFEAILSRDPVGHYVAACRSMPSCQTRGASPEEALDRLRTAIVAYLSPVMRVSPDLVDLSIPHDRSRRKVRAGKYISEQSANTPV